MIEFDIRFSLSEKDIIVNNPHLKYLIRTYIGTPTEIPNPFNTQDGVVKKDEFINKKECTFSFNKLELDLLTTDFTKINIPSLLKSNPLIRRFDLTCLLISPDKIHLLKTYPSSIFKFDLTIKHSFKPGIIRDLLFEHNKYIEVAFKHFLINKNIFLQNLYSLLAITKGKGLLFTSECNKFTELKGFSEKWSLIMATVLNSKEKRLIKTIYKNQLEMEKYHMNVFYTLVERECSFGGVITADSQMAQVYIYDKINPFFN
ncbi:hypothetical protein CDIK_0230 [Cucumispora dikerogammari]|nr:hypothetical protein CDIK_0230 [Cucumispora dikerogammari]